MGLLDKLLTRSEKALTASPAVIEAIRDGQFNQYQRLGGVNQQVNAAWLQTQSASYAFMYERQPAVRKVIDWIARNMAQLGLSLYERKSDTDRERDADHPAAETMEYPNTLGPGDQFIVNFVTDFLIHWNAYAIKFDGPGAQRTLIQVPPVSVAVNSNSRFLIDSYRFYRSDGTYFDTPPENVIHWRGYNPHDPRIGLSPLETLRALLAEDSATQAANVELMKSGLQKPGYIKRPLEAPEWSIEGMSRFQEGWTNQMKAMACKAPVLEEGMEFADFGISPKDAEMLESRRFTSEEVAAMYGMEHCPPEDEDERKQFIADVLTPLAESLAAQLDFSLLGQEYLTTDHYFEFNINSKLQGDPIARFQAITAATGAPWLLRNEARALENRPPVDGGDELIVPLNVIEGDNPRPAPNVMPPQDPNRPNQDGSFREQAALNNGSRKQLEVSTRPRRVNDMARQRRAIDEAHAMLERYYTRQADSVKGKSQKAVDTERWNRELADDVEDLVKRIVEREGGLYTARLGGEDFDMRQVENYIGAMSRGTAEGLNGATQRDITDLGVEDAMARAKNERASIAAASIGTRATVFARQEAAKQSPGTRGRMKTWIANSERHAELDGVSVPLLSDWGGIEPGSEPNCACSEMIT